MTYRVHSVGHSGNVYHTREIDYENDEEAIQAAHGMNARSVGAGFEVWQEDRLTHQHRN